VTFKDFITIIKLPFRKDRELYRSFYQILGFYPNDIRPYKQALMHKSYGAKGDHGQRFNNERLEFLGDAILDAVVGDIVYHHFPKKPEGFMTNTRSKIVQRETLNKIAVEIGLDQLIKSNGHAQTYHNSYMCGNAFEALVGAVYLDRGYRHCMRFMEKQILKRLVDIDKVAYKEVNFKSKLIEWSQKNRIQLQFQLVNESKEEGTTPTFITRVLIEGIDCGTGKGYSKKESQQNAAKEALMQMRKQKTLERKVFDAKGKRTAMEEEPTALLPEVAISEEKVQRKTRKKQKPATPAKENKAEETKSKAKKPAKEPSEAAKEATEQKRPRRKRSPRRKPAEQKAEPSSEQNKAKDDVQIDFSDVTMRQKSRDEIIAEAEAKAFGNNG